MNQNIILFVFSFESLPGQSFLYPMYYMYGVCGMGVFRYRIFYFFIDIHQKESLESNFFGVFARVWSAPRAAEEGTKNRSHRLTRIIRSILYVFKTSYRPKVPYLVFLRRKSVLLCSLALQVSIFMFFGANFDTYIIVPRSRRDLSQLSLQ